MKNHYILVLSLIIFITFRSNAQIIKVDNSNKNLTFTGTKAIQNEADYDTTSQLVLSGYISTYYAHYNDSVGIDEYQKFPTVSPYSDRFSVNMVQFGGKYTSDRYRGIFTLQWGDIPQSCWSSKYNLIQEANVGFKLLKTCGSMQVCLELISGLNRFNREKILLPVLPLPLISNPIF